MEEQADLAEQHRDRNEVLEDAVAKLIPGEHSLGWIMDDVRSAQGIGNISQRAVVDELKRVGWTLHRDRTGRFWRSPL